MLNGTIQCLKGTIDPWIQLTLSLLQLASSQLHTRDLEYRRLNFSIYRKTLLLDQSARASYRRMAIMPSLAKKLWATSSIPF